MNARRMKWISCFAVAAAIFLLAAPGSVQADLGEQNPKIKVVAAEVFWGEVAQAVGGDRVEVTSLISNPAEDPHDYEPTANDAKAVADAQVVVYTGIGYDDWVDKFLQADSSSPNKDVVAVGKDLLGKAAGDNPHIWYDPATMPKVAQKLADDLSELDPANAQDYQQRASDYIATLTPLMDKVASLRQPVPVTIDVSEPVFDYMADALNIKVNDPKFALAVEEGNDPPAADIATVQNDIQSKAIKFFVYNTQTDMPTVTNMAKLAEDNGVPVVKVTETEPAGENYLQWMTEQLDQVEAALNR